MKIIDKGKSVWYEKFKPQCIDDLIIPEVIKNKLKGYVQTQDIPNIGLFSSLPGTGKSSTAHAIIKEINGEAMWINASLEKGIDTLRGKLQKFASQTSFDDKIKMVVMDECLEENETVRIGTIDSFESIKLNELIQGVVYNCVSFNMDAGTYENDTAEVISDKEDTIYEVILEDGRSVKVTGNHPFIIEKDGIYSQKSIYDGLSNDDNIVTL